MAQVVVLGAAGQLGAAICAALLASSTSSAVPQPVVAVDRDAATVLAQLGAWAERDVLAAARADPACLRVVAGDPTDPELVAGLLGDADCCVHADARSTDVEVRRVATAAVAAGAHYLDVRTSPGHLAALADELGSIAEQAGRVVVPGLNADLVPGEALALLAAGAVAHPREVHVSFALPSVSGVLQPISRALTPGGRRAWLAQLLGPSPALVDGAPTDEHVAEARRLAWFPRPVGPVHAVGVSSAVAWSLPRQLLGVRTVRSYLAMPGWRAELVQLLGGASRYAPVRRRIEARFTRGGVRSRAVLGELRWAVVAEARGAGGEVARAWANGNDPLAVLGGTVAALVGVVADGVTSARPLQGAQEVSAMHEPGQASARSMRGVQPPSAVLAPEVLLDHLAARLPLRWSLVRPSTT